MQIRFLAVLSVLLMVGLFSNCGPEREAALSTQMKEQIALLPQDAGAYGYVNIQRLHKANFARFFVDSMKQQLTESAEFETFVAETGLDPEKDIHEAYFALMVNDNHKKPLGLVVAGGSFDSEKIIGFLKEKDEHQKLQEEKAGAHTLYVIADKHMTFCFYNSETLIGGARDLVIKWLEGRDSKGAKAAISPALLDDLNRLKYKQGMWLSVNPETWKTKIKNTDLKKFNGLKSLTDLGFSLDITDKIKFFAKGDFDDKEKAKLFEEAIRGFIAAGKLSVSDDRDVIDILNNIRVETKDGQVTVNFKVSEKEIKQLLDKQKTLKKKMFKAV